MRNFAKNCSHFANVTEP